MRLISSYSWDTAEILIENLLSNVIIPHIRKEEASCQNQSIA